VPELALYGRFQMDVVDKAYTKAILQEVGQAFSGEQLQPSALIGASFIFGDVLVEDGLHLIGGKVTSFGYSKKEGFRLYVTAPRFKGEDIKRFEKRDGVWVAISTKDREIKGVFVFI